MKTLKSCDSYYSYRSPIIIMKIQLKNIILLLAVVLACHLVSTKSVTSSDEKEAIQYINRLYGDYLKHKWTGLKMKNHLNHQQRLIPSKVHKPNIYEYYARRNSKFRRV